MESSNSTATADTVELAHDLEREIAKGSSTTGDALNRMKNVREGSVQLGESATALHLEEMSAEKRGEVFEIVQKDAEAGEKVFTGESRQARINKALDATSTKGRARVAGGAQAVEFQSDIVVGLSDNEKADESQNTNAHELSHATKQKPMGDVRIGKDVISGTDLHELISEEDGSKKETGSPDELRDDAPADYQRAHGHGKTFQALGVTREQYHKRVADGDTKGLQKDLIEGGIEKGETSTDEVLDVAEKGTEPHVRNAVVDLLKERSKTADAVRQSLFARLQPSLN